MLSDRFIKGVTGHPWWVVVWVIILVGLAASGASRLKFSNDYRIYFSAENPHLQAFEALQDIYSKNDNVLFVLQPRGGDVFTREVLEAVVWLTHESWQVPYSLRVDSISNFQHTHAEGDDLIVEDLVEDPESLSAEDLARIRRIATHEPMLRNRLISPRGDVTGVNVTVQLPGKAPTAEVPEVVRFTRDLAARLEQKFPHIKVYLTGVVYMNNAFAEATEKDMKGLVPLMFAVVLVGLALLLRTVSGTLISALVILLAVASTLGLTGWLGILLSPSALLGPTVIFTLAVADCVHLLSNFLHQYHAGVAKRAAIAESLRLNLQPVFLTSFTTALGFLSMNFSDSPPFRDFGNIVSVGVVVAFLLSITLLPALVVLLPVRARPRRKDRASRHHMEQLADFVITHQRGLFWGMGALIVLLISFIPRNELNDQYVKYFDPSIQFRTDTDFTTDHLTGIYSIQYSLPAGEPGGINDPGYLHTVEAFAQWYRKQPGVLHVSALTDIVKRLNRNLHGDDDHYYRIPDKRELAAQYLLLYELSLPYGLDLNNTVDIDKSASRFVVTLRSMSSRELLDTALHAKAWLAEHAPASMHTEGSSPGIMFSHIGQKNVHSMLLGTTVALFLISVLLIFALRSLKLGLLSLVPNLAPAGMAFGLWGLLVGEVGLALSVTVGMTLGIVVDDTIHFLSKYLRARREKGMGAEDAIRYAFVQVGNAMLVTSIVLVLGFSMLTFSAFHMNSDMGVLSAITIALALLADFLLLPTLLLKFEEQRDACAVVDHPPQPDQP